MPRLWVRVFLFFLKWENDLQAPHHLLLFNSGDIVW